MCDRFQLGQSGPVGQNRKDAGVNALVQNLVVLEFISFPPGIPLKIKALLLQSFR